MSEISEKVVDIIVDKLGVDRVDVTPQANFINDLSADSLDRVELIMECEKVFEFNIPDDDAEKLETVQQVIDYIELKESEK